MRIYKHKTEITEGGKETELERPAWGNIVRIESIYYSSNNPQDKLKILDSDRDEVWHVTGQEIDRPIILDIPITLQFPLYFLDERADGQNKVIIRGYLVDGAGLDKGLTP